MTERPTREHGKGGQKIVGLVLRKCQVVPANDLMSLRKALETGTAVTELSRERTGRPEGRATRPTSQDGKNLTPGSWVPETSLTRSPHCSTSVENSLASAGSDLPSSKPGAPGHLSLATWMAFEQSADFLLGPNPGVKSMLQERD